MLVRLVYASRSPQPVSNEVIDQILAQSRKNNLEAGITGVLCICHAEVFIQVLEGAREEVNRLYCNIVRDTRHTDITLLDYAEIDQRRFANWRMGRVDLDKLNAGVILKYSEKPRLDPFKVSGKILLALLEDLSSTASIVGGG